MPVAVVARVATPTAGSVLVAKYNIQLFLAGISSLYLGFDMVFHCDQRAIPVMSKQVFGPPLGHRTSFWLCMTFDLGTVLTFLAHFTFSVKSTRQVSFD